MSAPLVGSAGFGLPVLPASFPRPADAPAAPSTPVEPEPAVLVEGVPDLSGFGDGGLDASGATAQADALKALLGGSGFSIANAKPGALSGLFGG
ncbi:MAG: hypothetical protein FJX47_07495 [Alphaproteobacteria bacterium]|nr:hypothetical protein [Alphaproteobacteria bacterium]